MLKEERLVLDALTAAVDAGVNVDWYYPSGGARWQYKHEPPNYLRLGIGPGRDCDKKWFYIAENGKISELVWRTSKERCPASEGGRALFAKGCASLKAFYAKRDRDEAKEAKRLRRAAAQASADAIRKLTTPPEANSHA